MLTNTSGAVYALTVDENNLYVGMAPDVVYSESSKKLPKRSRERLPIEKRVFHSADFGDSWTEITPTDESQVMNLESAIQILAVGKTLFVLGVTEFRSSDGGKTWTRLRSNINSLNVSIFPAVAITERIFYKADIYGISRTTDAGASWHPYVNGMTGPSMHDLTALNHRLYMHIGRDIVQSSDRGKTWHSVRFNTHEHTPKLDKDFYRNIKLTITDNVLYAVSIRENKPSLFRHPPLAMNLFPKLHGLPAFEEVEAALDNSDELS